MPFAAVEDPALRRQHELFGEVMFAHGVSPGSVELMFWTLRRRKLRVNNLNCDFILLEAYFGV
jgi:hypothetical protein